MIYLWILKILRIEKEVDNVLFSKESGSNCLFIVQTLLTAYPRMGLLRPVSLESLADIIVNNHQAGQQFRQCKVKACECSTALLAGGSGRRPCRIKLHQHEPTDRGRVEQTAYKRTIAENRRDARNRQIGPVKPSWWHVMPCRDAAF